MESEPDIVAVAGALASRSRAAMVNLMLDGRSHPAGDLAREAGITVSTGSSHLSELVDAGLVAVKRVGRQRHYRLVGPEIASAIEVLAAVAPRRQPTFDRGGEAARIRRGRTCYDHLAGRLGMAITDGLLASGALHFTDTSFVLTRRGIQLMEGLGVDVRAARSRRRRFSHACLDWTEQRYHLGGALGAALCETLFAVGWVRRVGRGRAAALTEDGERSLKAALGVELGP